MKTIIISAIIAAAGLCACRNRHEEAHNTTLNNTLLKEEKAKAPVSLQITDPVCGMVKDSTWTDFSVINGDTVWFCSEIEKKAYLANPKKYQAK